MQAVRIHNHGGPEVLQVDDLPIPEIGNKQCLIEIKAAALNHLDIWVRKGIPGVPLPMIMGSDGSGIVREIGSEVNDFKIGDKVLLQPLTYCGKCNWCKEGKENYCEEWGIFGENQDGTQCEFMAVNSDHLRLIPESMSLEDAAAFPLVAETAYTMIVERAQIKKNECVFVWGASSGVGSMAIQIAKSLDCNVITTIGDENKRSFAAGLGAGLVLNYKTDDIVNEVKIYTENIGVDIVAEHIGTKTWSTSLRILGRGGRIVTCGATTGADAKFDIRHLFSKQQSILGSTMGSVESLDKMLDLYSKGKVKPVVDRCFKMSNIREAHEYLENGNQIGKVIVIP